MDYKELIDRNLMEEFKKEREKDQISKNLIASSSGQCHRKRILETFIPKEVDERAMRLFWLGDVIHDKIQSLIPGKYEVHIRGSFLVPEFHFAKENEQKLVSGKIDILTEDEILEIKTVHSRSFSYDVSEHYLFQVITYKEMYRILSGKEMKTGLIYVSRDDMRVAYIPIVEDVSKSFTEEVVKDWVEIEKEFEQFKEENILPEPAPRWDWECRYCPFAPDCEKGNLKEHVNKNFQKYSADT